MSKSDRVPGHVYRETRNGTVERWARRAGCAPRSWTRWENHGSTPATAYRVVGVLVCHGMFSEAAPLIAALHRQEEIPTPADELHAASPQEGGDS